MIGLVIDFYNAYYIIEYEGKLYAQEPKYFKGLMISEKMKLIKSRMFEVEQAYHVLREDIYYFSVLTK